MKKSRFTEVQVAYALRQAEAGTPVRDVPQPWHIRSHVLHLEEEVRRPGWQRGQAVAPARGRECKIEACGG
ncbi:hypothetical protein C8R31_10680 [Nitrosospira sp. Nsp2]|nr:hypothetical protein C8R31_10680 [Nitrosospira sp. Nsp2]